jgi:hypothetical protein
MWFSRRRTKLTLAFSVTFQRRKVMGNQNSGNEDQPPTPGGDPDQSNDDVPERPAVDSDENKGKDKSGYGHIGNKEVPRPEGAPPPHQIY